MNLKDEKINEIRRKFGLVEPKFKIVAVYPPLHPSRPCCIDVDEDVLAWLYETFTEGEDFTVTRSLKGVWAEMTLEAFTLLSLKWTTTN